MSSMRSSLFKMCVICGALWLSGSSAVAGDKRVYTLAESIAEALAKNHTLKAQERKVDQAVYLKKQAQTEFFPKLGTRYVYNRQSEARKFRSSLGQDIEISSQDNYEWRGVATQPIFTGFELTSSYELAKLGIDQSTMNLELEKLDLALGVKEAFFDILIADRGVEVAEKDVAFRKSNLRVARNFYDVGTISVNEVLRAEVELANAEQNLVTARNTAQAARAAFNSILTRPVNAPVEAVEPVPPWEPETGDFDAYVRRAFQARPEIKLIDINIRQADQEVRLAKSDFYPDVAVEYNYIKAGDDPSVSGSPFHDAGQWQATAVLTWTFWEWGKTRYAVKEKENLREELMQLKADLEDSIELQVKNAVLRLENAEENIPTTKKAVEQGEENLRVSQERYEAQVTTITEVLDAQTLLTRARVNYYRALYNHNLAKARLYRALGTY